MRALSLIIILILLPFAARADIAQETAAALKTLTEKRIALQSQRAQAEAELHAASAALSQKIAGAQLQGRDPLTAWALQGGTLQNAWQADILRRATTAPLAQRARTAREKQRRLDELDETLQQTTTELEQVQQRLTTNLQTGDEQQTLHNLLSALSDPQPSGAVTHGASAMFVIPASGHMRVDPAQNRLSITPLLPDVRAPARGTVLYVGTLNGLGSVVVLGTPLGRFVVFGLRSAQVTTGDQVAEGTRIASANSAQTLHIQTDGPAFAQLLDNPKN